MRLPGSSPGPSTAVWLANRVAQTLATADTPAAEASALPPSLALTNAIRRRGTEPLVSPPYAGDEPTEVERFAALLRGAR